MRIIGNETLKDMPNNAIILLNGDLETNVAMYYHYCERWRPDLTLLSTTHLTYDWFLRYTPNYPGVIFPGTIYHPTIGYDLKKFAEANIAARPIILIGSVISGDSSLENSEFEFRRVGIGFEIVRKVDKDDIWSLTECEIELNRTFIANGPRNISIPKHNFLRGTWEKELITTILRFRNANTAKELVNLAPKCPFPQFQQKLVKVCADIFAEMERHFDLFPSAEREEYESVYKFCYQRNQELCESH